jgi:hypothetical protein
VVFSANKIDCHEILLTVALNTITQALDEITQQKPLLLNDVHLYIHLGYGVTITLHYLKKSVNIFMAYTLKKNFFNLL